MGALFSRLPWWGQILAFLGVAIGLLGTFLFYYMGPQINVDPSGRTATGTWYMWLPATVSGRAMFISATYDEDYKKLSGRWFFSRMKINMKFITPYESGWVKEPMALG